MESLKDKNSDIVEEPAKLYDNPDDIDWQNEVPEDEKVKKLLADAEFIKCANANSNDDIDESEAMVIPTNNSQKVIEFALKKHGTKDEYVSFVLSKKLVPIDDSFRFYFCKLNGKSSVIEPAADKIYQIDNVGNFKVGCIYYSFDSLLYKDFLEKRNDKYFYANRYLTYV